MPWKILADLVTGLHLLLMAFFALSAVLLALGVFKGHPQLQFEAKIAPTNPQSSSSYRLTSLIDGFILTCLSSRRKVPKHAHRLFPFDMSSVNGQLQGQCEGDGQLASLKTQPCHKPYTG